jgi:cell division cycle 2-like protein
VFVFDCIIVLAMPKKGISKGEKSKYLIVRKQYDKKKSNSKTNFEDRILPTRHLWHSNSLLDDLTKFAVERLKFSKEKSNNLYTCLDEKTENKKISAGKKEEEQNQTYFIVQSKVTIKKKEVIANKNRNINNLSDANMLNKVNIPLIFESRDVECFDIVSKIDEGTFGVVYRAKDRSSGRVVALKKVKFGFDSRQYGHPINSIREIDALGKVFQANIVPIYEIVVGDKMDIIFLVLELMDHDLKSLIENMGDRYFIVSEVKNIMVQLLSGLSYLHGNWILHRDVKTSNVLLNNNGEVRLCDFGLARQLGNLYEIYTPTVITPCYRPPELFFGQQKYSNEVDLWSCGCIMGELFRKEQLFKGDGEVEILNKIFSILGTPKDELCFEWNKIKKIKNFKFLSNKKCNLRFYFPTHHFDSRPVLSINGLDLLKRLLSLNPLQRISSLESLQHPWFQEIQFPEKNYTMPIFPSTTALDFKHRFKVRYADPLERAILLGKQKVI